MLIRFAIAVSFALVSFLSAALGEAAKEGTIKVGDHCAVSLDQGTAACLVTLDGDGTEPPLHPTGKEFDSSWSRNQPAGFSIGVGEVIPGWDKALVGVKVGSRVLLVVPPADGYGSAGQSAATERTLPASS